MIASCPWKSLGVLYKSNRSFKQKFGAILLQASLHMILYRKGKAYKAALTMGKEKKARVESISKK